jgi:hypothetical protein
MFLNNLEVHQSFSDVFDTGHYQELPEDWIIFVSDVQESTKAIANGRYKEVNTIGATCIISCINASEAATVCYQFGGDGALVASSPQNLDNIKEALVTCFKIAQREFNLTLRVQAWSYSDFKKHGGTIKVLKYQVGEKQHLFMFTGKGIEMSDLWLKGEAPTKGLIHADDFAESFRPEVTEGLECRWNPLVSQRGNMVTAIIKPRTAENKILHDLHQKVDRFGEGGSRLIQSHNMRASWPPKHYYTEWRVRTGHRGLFPRLMIYLKTMGFILLVTPLVWLFKTKIPYIQELRAHTDFEKYDGTLRFVRDLTDQEFESLESELEKLFTNNKIFYGLHRSPTALMTCMVMSQEDHLHFIDGDDGGYAMAAKQLKEQLAQSKG